jgi:hypothetical protein
MNVDWKAKIDEIDANRIDLVLGNYGELPSFRLNGKDHKFKWPDQKVKALLIRDYLSDWAKTVEEMPDGKVKRELIKQMGKEVRSVGISQLMEYFGSGEQAIVNYMYHCSTGDNKLTKEEILGHIVSDTKDEVTGMGFSEFTSLHVARMLVVYIQGKGREVALDFLKNLRGTLKTESITAENTPPS